MSAAASGTVVATRAGARRPSDRGLPRSADPVMVMLRRRKRLRAILLRPVKNFGYARKHDLCLAIRGGLVTKNEAVRAHSATFTEIDEWLTAFDAVCAGAKRSAAS